MDAHMHTNIDNIYAAGDIAEYNGRVGGLWTIAIEQGKIAGSNIAGKSLSYTGILPVTTINVFELNVFSVGTIDDTAADITLIEDPGDGKSYKRLFIKDNTLIGAIIIGEIKHNNMLKKFVTDKIKIPDTDFSSLTVAALLEKLSAM